jgi:NitT/TauT family transport system ATP-binding protein
MTTLTAPALEMRRVLKRFKSGGYEIFHDLSLTVGASEVVAVVGASGSGKSTLLNICALVDDVQGGEIMIEGQLRTTEDAGSVPVAYIFQRDALIPWKTVLDNTLLGARCKGRVTFEMKERAREYLTRFGLKGYEDKYPETLSGGQRQRVAIIQSLLVAPHILLLDEPFASLDFQTKLILEEELMRIIRGGTNGYGRHTALIVTHDIEEALVLADRVVVLGRYEGQPAQIVLEMQVGLAADKRDPVKARESRVLRESFEHIWSTIKPYVMAGN